MSINIFPHPGGTPGITPWRSSVECRSDRCEMALNIGLFFDGTGNNLYADEPALKQSNVARLFLAYPLKANEGFYPIYIPGLGTPFPQIGELQGNWKTDVLGMGFGWGGDGRVVYGLLQVLASVHEKITGGQILFDDTVILALCRNGPAQITRYGYLYDHQADAAALASVGMAGKGGLLTPDGVGGHRFDFLKAEATKLATALKETKKPVVKEIVFDVFGFSRGATEARVFCNWLYELFSGGTLVGVKSCIRFLGIFDTVASVGLPLSVPLIGGKTDGHLAWANENSLKISPSIKNCHHYVAMHENRAGFPLDLLAGQSGGLPTNCKEYGFPGMHSDVGGGYSPTDQSRGTVSDFKTRDTEKLSQIPLKHMLDAALQARVPLDIETAAGKQAAALFKVHDNVQQAYDNYFKASGKEARPLREWLKQYLAYRYQQRHSYIDLCKARGLANNSQDTDLDNIQGANQIFLNDVELFEEKERQKSWGEKAWSVYKSTNIYWHLFSKEASDARRMALLHSAEAFALYQEVKAAPASSTSLAAIFIDYCHDSYAGFRPLHFKIAGRGITKGWELQGYFHLRRHYRGDGEEIAFMLPPSNLPAQRQQTAVA